MSSEMQPIYIDAMGKPCPMPLLLLKKALKQHPSGSVYLLKASDPNSKIDLIRYCQIQNLTLECTEISPNEFHYHIES